MTHNPLDLWNVSREDYPADGSEIEKLKFMLRYAILAPSGHNTQPWIFKITNSHIEVYADRGRELPEVDPEHRELFISCAAALFNLRAAIRYFGYEDHVEILPDSKNANLVAVVSLGGQYHPTDEDQQIFNIIPKRRTHRLPFKNLNVPESVVFKLVAAVESEGAWLHVIGQDEKQAVADLVAKGDELLLSRPDFREEFVEWLRPNKSNAPDGIPGYAFGLGNLASTVAPFLIRKLDVGKSQGAKDRKTLLNAPLAAVLGTPGDTPHDWITAGQALQRLLLVARKEEIYAGYLNQPIEAEELRPVLRDNIGVDGFPQILLRLGYGSEPRLTPRRSLDDVVVA